MKTKQKLGPLQKRYVNALKEMQSNQCIGSLYEISLQEPTSKMKFSDGKLCRCSEYEIEEKFCALGVCTKLFKEDVLYNSIQKSAKDWEFDDYGLEDEEIIIPGKSELTTELKNLLRFRTKAGKIVSGCCEYKSIMDMNDSGVSFLKIARFIEDNPAAVFTEPV